MANFKAFPLSDLQFMLREIDVSGKRLSDYNKNFIKTVRKMLNDRTPLSVKQQQHVVEIYGYATDIGRRP